METSTADPAQFIHVRMVLSMVVSLAIARLLSGLARFVQHPDRQAWYGVHALWTLYMLVMLIHFWWWEFALSRMPAWHFGAFAFVVGYAALLYLLCAILYPDDVGGYAGFRGYFLSRRKWFFGILGTTFVVDVVDTALKGGNHLAALGVEYGVRTCVGAALCVVAIFVDDERFHWALVIAALAYQVSRIVRLYDVLG